MDSVLLELWTVESAGLLRATATVPDAHVGLLRSALSNQALSHNRSFRFSRVGDEGVPPKQQCPPGFPGCEAVAQIMFGLIHSALGMLWIFLYNLEEEQDSVGTVGMIVIIFYMLASGSFFVNSGSSSIIYGDATTCQVVLAIVANILSSFVSIIGIIIMGIEFPAFESLGTEYIWSNMAGMMLLQISAACTISELIIAIIMAHWFRRVFDQQKLRGEGSTSSKSISESLSQHEMEKFSECSKPRLMEEGITHYNK
ncbi:uncharacterized protein LOC128123785 [Peromyscus californicus insignis]|uniref:uncharacterized protein LOC128123785 n=1 Tax=Peromyscus californicus insignis TaxID=564181 RepID=UPI0022A74A9B|nr:uncharacterized protein LOC128123785 [Peromyscus californicus insignis]